MAAGKAWRIADDVVEERFRPLALKDGLEAVLQNSLPNHREKQQANVVQTTHVEKDANNDGPNDR